MNAASFSLALSLSQSLFLSLSCLIRFGGGTEERRDGRGVSVVSRTPCQTLMGGLLTPLFVLYLAWRMAGHLMSDTVGAWETLCIMRMCVLMRCTALTDTRERSPKTVYHRRLSHHNQFFQILILGDHRDKDNFSFCVWRYNPLNVHTRVLVQESTHLGFCSNTFKVVIAQAMPQIQVW